MTKGTEPRSVRFHAISYLSPCHFCFRRGVLFQRHRQVFPELLYHLVFRIEAYFQNWKRKTESKERWQVFISPLIFCKPALKIFQPLKMLKRIAFLRQLRTLRPSSHPLILAWAIVFYPHMDSWDATSFEIVPHRRTFESPNRSVTKSTLWRSSGLLNQTDTRAITSMRILERPEYVSLSASWEP